MPKSNDRLVTRSGVKAVLSFDEWIGISPNHIAARKLWTSEMLHGAQRVRSRQLQDITLEQMRKEN